MASKALIAKAKKIPKFSVRKYSRCLECGRSRAVFRLFGLCRIHFRNYIYAGLLAGWKKHSW